MTDLTQALAEVKRAFPGINNPWTGEDFALNETAAPIDHAIATILNAAASGELIPLADHKLAVADAFRRALGAIADLPTPLHEETKCGHEDAYRAVAAVADTNALAEVQALRAERDDLRAAIFGSRDYWPDLRNGNFIAMAATLHAAQKGGLARAEAAEAELAATQAKLERLETLPPDFGHDGLRWKIGVAMVRNIEAAHPQTDRIAALYHAFRAGLRAAVEGAKP